MVTKVEELEPLSLRKEWMNDLAQAVSFLNLAHSDLRPENNLLNRDRLNCQISIVQQRSEQILKFASLHIEEYLTATSRTKEDVGVPVS